MNLYAILVLVHLCQFNFQIQSGSLRRLEEIFLSSLWLEAQLSLSLLKIMNKFLKFQFD